jgi:DNA-binding MarR family transcriptional regulator
MFFLEHLPDPETMSRFAARFPEMEIDTTAACLRLLKVASTLLRELEHHFSGHGLSQARFLALVVLECEPAKQLVPVEIARQMGISKKNTARLLAFMEEDKLASRASHDTDGRASIVKITTKGAKLLSEVLPGYYQVLNRAMSPLDGKTKKALIAILDRILDRVDPEARSRQGPRRARPSPPTPSRA